MTPRYGIRVRRSAGQPWRRGMQFARTTTGGITTWRPWRRTWPTRKAAELRLKQYQARGYMGHVFQFAEPPRVAWRDRIVADMRWTLSVEPRIHYRQERPFDVDAIARRRLPLTTDCSGSTTMLYRAAGRPDPNGRNYDGTGYTGTLRAHTPKRRTVHACLPGDFIVYGAGSGAHVVVVLEPGPDPLVWSHGQEAGPLATRHSVQVRVHGSTFTCHNGDALT